MSLSIPPPPPADLWWLVRAFIHERGSLYAVNPVRRTLWFPIISYSVNEGWQSSPSGEIATGVPFIHERGITNCTCFTDALADTGGCETLHRAIATGPEIEILREGMRQNCRTAALSHGSSPTWGYLAANAVTNVKIMHENRRRRDGLKKKSKFANASFCSFSNVSRYCCCPIVQPFSHCRCLSRVYYYLFILTARELCVNQRV